jgi:uncharacterized damage-inducible protein DinB
MTQDPATADLVREHARLLAQLRAVLLERVSGLSDEQLLRVPDGFANNILWNLAHLAVTQQLLVYGRSGLDLLVEPELIEHNRKGTSPANWTAPPDPIRVKALLLELPERMAADADRLTTFDPYPTSTGVVLGTVADALRYNLYHEGLHAGTVGALARLVSAPSR